VNVRCTVLYCTVLYCRVSLPTNKPWLWVIIRNNTSVKSAANVFPAPRIAFNKSERGFRITTEGPHKASVYEEDVARGRSPTFSFRVFLSSSTATTTTSRCSALPPDSFFRLHWETQEHSGCQSLSVFSEVLRAMGRCTQFTFLRGYGILSILYLFIQIQD